MARTISSAERYGWTLVMSMLVIFAIPWVLWGNDRIIVGLPLWLWWHICWMIGASLVFSLFARRAWGLGIIASDGTGREGGEQA
jgi:hypothetical protein